MLQATSSTPPAGFDGRLSVSHNVSRAVHRTMAKLSGQGITPFTRVAVHVSVDGEDERWVVSLAEQLHDPPYYSLHIATSHRKYTLFRSKNEIAVLHDKLCAAYPGFAIPPSPFPSSLTHLNRVFLSKLASSSELLGIDGKGVLRVAGYFKALVGNRMFRDTPEWKEFLSPRHAIPHDLEGADGAPPQGEKSLFSGNAARARRTIDIPNSRTGNKAERRDGLDNETSRQVDHIQSRSRPFFNPPPIPADALALDEDTRGEKDTDSETAYTVESDIVNHTNDGDAFFNAGSTLRRRHVSGYKVDSEDEDKNLLDITSPTGKLPPATSDRARTRVRDRIIIIRPPRPSHVVYDAPNLLPVASVASARLGRAVSDASSSLFDDCTYYRDLREALHDAHLDAVKSKLVQEWTFAGSILGGLVALGTTVFGFNSDTIFSVDSLSVRALAASTACAALGLTLAIWLLFRCWAADAQAFKRFARGVYSTYFFFALTSRLPLLLMLLSLCSLVVFVLDITLRVLPSGIGILCILVGVLCLLQYIVRGAELVVSGLTRALYAVRATGRELAMALRTGPAAGTTTSAPEGPARSPATTAQTGSTTFTPR